MATQAARPEEQSADTPPGVDALLGEVEPLFAVLDAARDRGILPLLREVEAEHRILYGGRAARELADYGPYLVRLDTKPEARAALLRAGWGSSWGIFLSTIESRMPHASTRRLASIRASSSTPG